MPFDYDPLIPLEFDAECDRPDYHAVVTIQLCELIDAGFFDLTRADWDFGPKYSAEQHTQLCRKITDHYYYREIALTPPGIWKREFLRKMNEIMPKYIPWYKLLDDEQMRVGHSYDIINGNSDTNDTTVQTDTNNRTEHETRNNDEYYKSRNIFSDFPQTALAGNNSDYASTGNDTEYERIIEDEKNSTANGSASRNATTDGTKSYSETREHIADPLSLLDNITQFDNVDAMIINEMESLFSCMFTVNINAW